ncbi:MAG: isopentenyl-diphosphate Delta-isomerase [Armatimonadota bacterium]
MTTISIVIPTLNEENNIGRLINALLNQSHKPIEIIVVDGGSTDNTSLIVSNFPEVTFLQTKPSVGGQRQMGLENAKGDIVIFLDADTIPTPDFIQDSIDEMKKRNLDIACPWYKPYPSSFSISAFYIFFNTIFFLIQKILASGAGSCILAKRELALRAGGFKDISAYEDMDFIRKASRKGKFGNLKTGIWVSDRRLREYGTFSTFLKYMLLSLFFTFGLFGLAEKIVKYPFAKYKKSNEECVVLVDDNNKVLGTELKSKVHTADTKLHRAFSIFIFNDKGELLLQQRSKYKKTWALQWSNSCCGHPMLGESIENAAKRRAFDELGVELKNIKVILPNFRYKAQKDGIVENEICPVLVGFINNNPAPNPIEVEDIQWMNWQDFMQLIEKDGFLSPWCIEEAKQLNSCDEFLKIIDAN